MCSICRNYNPVVSSFITNHRISIRVNTAGVTNVAGVTDPSRVTKSIHVFSGVPTAQSLEFCVVCLSTIVCIWSFSFFHCIVCPSINGCWWSLWDFQNVLFLLFYVFLYILVEVFSHKKKTNNTLIEDSTICIIKFVED